ncbi:MAG: SIMPL domain-containing protein [Hyphomicrobiaceae bacterium]
MWAIRSGGVAAVTALVMLGAVMGGADRVCAEQKDVPRTLTVSAEGRVSVVPDIAHVTTGVVVEAPTAREALSRNSELMAKVVAGLKAAGIAAKDIQTSNLSVQPVHKTYRDGRPPEVHGYRVSNTVHLKVRKLAELGAVVDKVVTLGANQVSGIGFDIARREAVMDEARRQAVAVALERARLYAAAAGVTLGPIQSISETVHGVAPYRAPAGRALAAAPPPIEAGSLDVSAQVHIVWLLR